MKNKNRKQRNFKIKGICLALILLTLFSLFTTGAYAKSERDDVIIKSRITELLFGRKEKKSSGLMLIPGGDVFGVKISGVGVSVSRVLTEESENPLKAGDKIERINGKEVLSSREAKQLLSECDGGVTLDIIRDGRKIKINAEISSASDEPKLGVLLTDSAAGIGTVTYINPKTQDFGGLGHGICDPESGAVLPMYGGEATGVILGGASRGEAGKPGELRGILTHDTLGSIILNTKAGVFGRLNDDGMTKKCTLEPLPVGAKEELKEGPAEIISTVKSGRRASYTIEISDIDRSSDGSKSFRIKVTDDTLIALTGGIVRGMSGSPIIQDGKLVGAVTHVLVANPTEGYGIFIENMLNAAQNQVQPKAA